MRFTHVCCLAVSSYVDMRGKQVAATARIIYYFKKFAIMQLLKPVKYKTVAIQEYLVLS